MKLSSTFDQFHFTFRQNRWLWYFSIFCRFALALGFIPAGLTKILDERFASGLSVNHPMGHYLEALHHTGYYYTFIGIAQVIAAILLLIPRTVTLGAFLYLPIILNICILSIAVRFDGSLVTSPLMVLANLYVLFWNYDRWKFILPFNRSSVHTLIEKPKKLSNKFPVLFFAAVAGTMAATILFALFAHDVMPHNNPRDCVQQFVGSDHEQAGLDFCDCIHSQGRDLNECLEEFEKARN